MADKITLERIEKMHPAVRYELKADYLYCNNKILGKGVRLRFTHTLRTFKEQDELYALGRSKPGKKVTAARGGQSYHNYGLAFDIVLLLDTDGNGTYETASWDRVRDMDRDKIADWVEVVNYFEEKGWKNGAYFGDAPHFQKTFGYHWRELLAKYEAGDFVEDGYVSLTDEEPEPSLEEIAKLIERKAGATNCWEEIAERLKKGQPLPFKLNV